MRLSCLPLVLLCACTTGNRPENILVIISDDIGMEHHSGFGSALETYTPTIEALADEGMRFSSMYSSPTCSPSRSTLMTGRLPTRHGVGRWIGAGMRGWDLALDEVTIAEMLTAEARPRYHSGAAGKWHMMSFFRGEESARHPLDQGFESHRGSLSNPGESYRRTERDRGFFYWEKSVDGELQWTDTYMTTDTIDEALALMDELPEPWFIWVALNAAHTPLHVPPDHLNPMGVTEEDNSDLLFDADILAFDMELDRMIQSMDADWREDTTLIYMADNGSTQWLQEAPYPEDRGKSTTFEAGIRVPFVVVSPRVREPGSTSDALVHFADLFPTVAAIAGVDPEPLTYDSGPREGESLRLDGHSLLPLLVDPSAVGEREVLFSEAFFPNGPGPWDYHDRTVRNHTHKLKRFRGTGDTVETFFDVYGGLVDEGEPLDLDALTPEEQVQLDLLRSELDRIEADLEFSWE